MRFRSTLSIALSIAAIVASNPVAAQAASKKPLVLEYKVEEGLNGRVARGAVFKAWIGEGRPVVGITNEDGKVALELGRALKKGETLFVEGESEDGNRSYSWIYKETPLYGQVESACQLVGIDDFRHPTILTAQKPQD